MWPLAVRAGQIQPSRGFSAHSQRLCRIALTRGERPLSFHLQRAKSHSCRWTKLFPPSATGSIHPDGFQYQRALRLRPRATAKQRPSNEFLPHGLLPVSRWCSFGNRHSLGEDSSKPHSRASLRMRRNTRTELFIELTAMPRLSSCSSLPRFWRRVCSCAANPATFSLLISSNLALAKGWYAVSRRIPARNQTTTRREMGASDTALSGGHPVGVVM
jgi:hypothetical protein